MRRPALSSEEMSARDADQRPVEDVMALVQSAIGAVFSAVDFAGIFDLARADGMDQVVIF